MQINRLMQNKYIILVKYAKHAVIEKPIHEKMWNAHKTCSPVRVANFSDTEIYFPLFRLFHILSLSTFNFSHVLRL